MGKPLSTHRGGKILDGEPEWKRQIGKSWRG